jgi:hypothetical protein
MAETTRRRFVGPTSRMSRARSRVTRDGSIRCSAAPPIHSGSNEAMNVTQKVLKPDATISHDTETASPI